jgi:hypothetical protein
MGRDKGMISFSLKSRGSKVRAYFLFLLVTFSVQAQDFDKDFVKSGGVSSEIGRETTPKDPKENPTAIPEKKQVSPELPKEEAPFSELPGTPISKIGLIVWGEDESHLSPTLYEYNKVIDSFPSIEIGDLVILGDPEMTLEKAGPHLAPKDFSKETLRAFVFTTLFSARPEDTEDNSDELSKEFAKILENDPNFKRRLRIFNKLALVKSPPKELNITHSPAWVVTVDRGDILIEGIQNISRFINSKGELLEEELKG